jgi:hypothetical protein
MDIGYSNGFSKERLGRWEFERRVGYPPDRSKPSIQFENKVSQSVSSIPLTDVAYPFPKYSSINEDVPPERFGHMRSTSEQFSQRIMVNETQDALAQSDYLVILHMKVEALQIWNVTRLVKGKDLAVTFSNYL